MRPPWWRRILFLGLIITAGGVVWKQQVSISIFVIVIILISFAESKFVLQVLDVSNGGVLFSGRGCSPGQRLPSYHFNLDPDLVWEPTTFCKQSYRCFFPVFISTTTFFSSSQRKIGLSGLFFSSDSILYKE